MTSPQRRLWQIVEPYHALTYFAPECHAAFAQAGLRGFWRGYFAGRAAPMGAVGAGPVTASFYGFAPSFVERAVPEIWSMITPAAAVEARLRGIDAAVREAFGGVPDVGEAARQLREAVGSCSAPGRPLFAANAGLEWPDEPHLELWHAATLLREHRGDGHVVALVAAGLDPCEAHLTQVLAAGAGLGSIAPYRGWTDEDWDAAAARLRDRGLMQDGALTAAGTDLRRSVESETDRLAAAPAETLGARGVDELCERLLPVAAALAGGTIPYPNPVGVPAPA